MKTETTIGISASTSFYMLCGATWIRCIRQQRTRKLLDWEVARKQISEQGICHRVFQDQSFEVNLEVDLCYRSNASWDDVSIFQCDSGSNRVNNVLAINSIFPHRNVHFAGKDSKEIMAVDLAEGTELGVLDCVESCCRWIDSSD
ncbi:hypothetical protein E3N88_06250 [Mikania micrantha]|uniref:Uncharacterized protein n=1 Tax=Mikania micrantha TaxID=192012 RepID=A0A5N6PN76_9ASTR|nr:hypothetical protein E3N88_06250 [Mikania micrantha]